MKNLLHPFLIDHSHIRGRVVRLGDAADVILKRHTYPEAVSHLLAELLVVAAMLSSNLKTGGMLTLQAKGDGPVNLLVVDATNDGQLRGYAQIDDARRKEIPRYSKKRANTLQSLMGQGYLAITLDNGGPDGRYQGIVELTAETLTQAVSHYFTQSHQVQMGLKLLVDRVADKKGKKHWRAGGIMLERLPQIGGVLASGDAGVQDRMREPSTPAGVEDQWNRNHMFMETVTVEELLGEKIDTWQLLNRLFGEEGVWAYPPQTITVGCRCSRERIENVLRSMEETELADMFVRGKISVKCQFCNTSQHFTRKQVHELYQ